MVMDQTFWIPLAEPVLNDRLVMEVYDEGTMSDTIIGSLIFNVKKLLKLCEENPEGLFMWRDLYGAPLGYDSSAAVETDAEEVEARPE